MKAAKANNERIWNVESNPYLSARYPETVAETEPNPNAKKNMTPYAAPRRYGGVIIPNRDVAVGW